MRLLFEVGFLSALKYINKAFSSFKLIFLEEFLVSSDSFASFDLDFDVLSCDRYCEVAI